MRDDKQEDTTQVAERGSMQKRTWLAALLSVALMISVLTTAASVAAADPSLEAGETALAAASEIEAVATDDGGDARTLPRRRCTSGVRWVGKCAIAGYAIQRGCGKAWCGLVGTLGSGKKRFYRADPMASNRPRGYKKTRTMQKSSKRRGHCHWTKRSGRQAAYLLAKYGKHVDGNNRQAASLDLAVTHLLCKRKAKRWKIGGKANNNRLRQAARRYGFGKARKTRIRRKAHGLVTESRRQRGPYRMSVSATEAVAGQPVTVRAKIRSGSSRAASSRRVVLRMPDGSATDAYTNSNGVASWTFTMNAGTSRLTVRAPRLEQFKLFRKSPKNRRASRLMLGGKHYSIRRRVTVSTLAIPTLRISANSATIPQPLRATMTYNGSLGGTSRKVTVRLRGPGGASMSCTSGSVVASTSWNLTANGQYNLPRPGGAWAPKVGNRYYRWQVIVAGDSQNTRRSACSAPKKLNKAAPVIPKKKMEPTGGTTFNKGQKIKPASFRYSGGHGSGGRDVVTRVWGPFSSRVAASCSAGKTKIVRQKTWRLSANNRYGLIKPGSRVTLRRAGWFKFQILVKGNNANAAAKQCGPAFRVRR